MSICDPKIFKEVFIEWARPIQRFIQSKGVDLAQAADLSQEAFLRLWKNCGKVSTEKSKAFLFTVANNLVIDNYRKEQTQIKLKQSQTIGVEKSDGQYELEMAEFKMKLEGAINTMTPGSKEVFLLNRFNDMTYRQIAEQLEISVKAVEKRMSGALKHLIKKQIWIKENK